MTSQAQQNASTAADISTEVHFTIKTKTGSTIFHIGEVIPLELSFSSSKEKTYQINMASYDRSGRMSYETFVVEPGSGWRDPLQDYFSSFFGIGGGLTTFRFLSEQPIVLSLQLNEWVRFDAPGKYRLQVATNRVADIRNRDAGTIGGSGQTITSNAVELTIIAATKEWQDRTLRAAVETIDRAAASAASSPASQTSEAVQTATKALRYLSTTAAAQQMAQRLKDDDNARDYSFGLIGSPEHETALKEMEQELNRADYPVADNFLLTMSVLSVQPGQSPEAMRQARGEAYEQIRAQLWQAIPKKQGTAKSISLVTAAFSGTDQKLSDEAIEQLAENFDSLPTQKQEELIEYRWDAIKSPAFLPILRKYARQYQDFPMLNESNAYASIHLSGAALQHWYELAPEEARAAVIEEMLRPKPRFDSRSLGFLPDKALPEIENTLVERLRSSDNYQISGNLASLIERYGTKAVLPQMLSIIDEKVGKWECAVQTPALAYLLRIDPASAQPRIEAAIAARGKGFTGCNHSLFVEVGKLHSDPVLEQIAYRSLSDDDAQVAANAASFLGQFGSAAAEHHLWERFQEWSNEWHGREAELKFIFGEQNPNQEQAGLGRNLAQALATGEAWLADGTRLQKIAQLSVQSDERQQFERMSDAWKGNWSIACFGSLGGAPSHCAILQYTDLSFERLKEKLSQFPRGSAFKWFETVQPKTPNQDNLYMDLSQFLDEHGMALAKTH